MKPRVSLGLPVYNGEKFIAESIGSILAQDYDDFELIITDNHSSDATADICRDFVGRDSRIKYFKNDRNLGAGPNFNRAFELASGVYFKWCASDDRLSPNYIGACVRALEDRPDAALAYGKTQSIDQQSRPIPLIGSMMAGIENPKAAHRFRRIIREIGTCYEVFGLFRADCLRRSSLHRPYYGSDRALLAEAALLGSFVLVPDAVFYNREHPTRSINIDKNARRFWHTADLRGGNSREHCQLLAHLVSIAAKHRDVAPLHETLPTIAGWALTPVQMSRYVLELAGSVLPEAKYQMLRKAGWSAAQIFRK